MNKKFKNILKVGLLAACVAVASNRAEANASLQYFGTTNSIDSSAASITSWPTNYPTTNGITWTYTNFVITAGVTNPTYTTTLYPGQLTGKAIEVGSYEHVALNVQGWLVNTNASAGTLGINLVTATTAPGQPPLSVANVANVTLGINTNGVPADANLAQNNFEYPASHWIIIPIPANTTNWFNFSTNLIETVNGAATTLVPDVGWVGIYQITNNLTATCYLVNPNGVAALSKKVIPSPITGQ
ncbi:MAG: hypothetical protein KGL39_03030 [Patescibacteria group bacterium]|nr:hypothetical protein [Patescibacteria group bacterium]